jgi:transcriptional regulator with XRE-family HTH domain
MTIIDMLKRLKDRGLSQTAIANLTGISQPKLSRWAGGAVPDSAKEALELQRLFDRTMAAPAPADATDKASA